MKRAQHILSRQLTVVLAMLLTLYCLVACTANEGASGQFIELNEAEGWYRSLPLVFEPEYPDSTVSTYDIVVAVRHTNSFNYSNLHLMVDLMADGSHLVRRIPVELDIADEFGNWHGTGFGTLFQCKSTVARGVSKSQARKVIVWQAMNDTTVINHITEVGILVEKH